MDGSKFAKCPSFLGFIEYPELGENVFRAAVVLLTAEV
jgi:hypothetical protein